MKLGACFRTRWGGGGGGGGGIFLADVWNIYGLVVRFDLKAVFAFALLRHRRSARAEGR